MYKLTRRWPPVGWVLSFSSRPTTWVRVGEGNFALPPSHAHLHGPARAFPLSFFSFSAVASADRLAEGGSRRDGRAQRLELSCYASLAAASCLGLRAY